MIHAACDLMWIQNVMKELGVKNKGSIIMFFDNQVAIYIAINLIFLKLIKHIRVDYHLIRDIVKRCDVMWCDYFIC